MSNSNTRTGASQPALLRSSAAATGKSSMHSARTLELLSAEIILNWPPTESLIEHLLMKKSVALLTGTRGSFKSFIALYMAFAVACSIKFLGFSTKTGPVIYIAGEGVDGLKLRLRALMNHFGFTEPPAQLYFLAKPINCADHGELQMLLEEMCKINPLLIVFDTLARCSLNLDENSVRDMGLLMGGATRLANETGATVLFIHHNNRNGDYRGSSSLPAAVDTHISVERRGDLVTLRCEKQKESEEFSPITLEKRKVDFPNGRSSLVFQKAGQASDGGNLLNRNAEKVLEVLIECYAETGATFSQWKKACCDPANSVAMPERTFARARQLLTVDGYVRSDKPASEKGAKYFPTEKATSECQMVPKDATGTNDTDQNK